MGKRHKLFKFLMLGLFVASTALGQTNNFEFTQQDADYTGSEDLVVMHGEIISQVSTSQSLTVTRVTHEIPASWTTSFCVGPACLPPFLDTYTFDLAGLDTAEFSLDTYPHSEEGVGRWTIFAVDSTTLEVDSVNIRMEFVTVGIDEPFSQPRSFQFSAAYPNPTNAYINFDLVVNQRDEFSVSLITLDGREVLARNYHLEAGKNRLQWNLQGLASGTYILRAINNGKIVSRQVSVIK